MKKVLFLGSISLKRNRLDGVTIKSRTLVRWLNDKKINLEIIDTDNWTRKIGVILYKVIKAFNKCDVIIISSADRGAYYALRLLNLLKVKKEIYYFVAGGRFADTVSVNINRIKLYEKCRKIFVESEEMNQKLKELGLNNTEMLCNFRYVSKEIQIKRVESTTKFVYFGRVIAEKGILDAIRVIKNIIAKGYNVNFDIYGEVAESFFREIEPYLDENIKYCGKLSCCDEEKTEIFSKYDVLLFPTKYPGECLPGTLIEAYISGLAIIASNWRYAKEYIENEKVGYIFEYNNINDFEEKVAKLLNDKERINSFKIYSKKVGEKYNCDNVLKSFYMELRIDIY